MDELQTRILTVIERNSRVDSGELAVRLGVSEEEINSALLEMEEEGIICGYHTMTGPVWKR